MNPWITPERARFLGSDEMLLTVRDLAFRYHNADHPVLRGLNLDLNTGECIAITGPNGSGKSTLISILAGIIPSFVDGELTGAITFHRAPVKPAVALQNPDTQILCDSVEKELLFFLTHSGSCPADAWPREIAAWVGIDDLLARKVYQLSYGEKQRLIAACALLCGDGKLILLDEPSAHLDDDGVTRLLNLLDRKKAEGVSIVLIGHECSRFRDLIDRWYLLNDGRLIESQERRSHCLPPIAKPGCAMPVSRPFISIRDIAYRNDLGEMIFAGFNGDIHKGRVYGLTGPNGSGKSSLARLVSGVERIEEGDIILDGIKASAGTLRKHVKMVGQNPFHQLLYKTVGANLKSTCKRIDKKPMVSPEEGIRMLNLESLLSRDVATLSFGEAQRVALLWAVLQSPELLIIDESFATLDDAGVDAFAEMLSVLKEKGKSILLISQIERSIAAISDYIFSMT